MGKLPQRRQHAAAEVQPVELHPAGSCVAASANTNVRNAVDFPDRGPPTIATCPRPASRRPTDRAVAQRAVHQPDRHHQAVPTPASRTSSAGESSAAATRPGARVRPGRQPVEHRLQHGSLRAAPVSRADPALGSAPGAAVNSVGCVVGAVGHSARRRAAAGARTRRPCGTGRVRPSAVLRYAAPGALGRSYASDVPSTARDSRPRTSSGRSGRRGGSPVRAACPRRDVDWRAAGACRAIARPCRSR